VEVAAMRGRSELWRSVRPAVGCSTSARTRSSSGSWARSTRWTVPRRPCGVASPNLGETSPTRSCGRLPIYNCTPAREPQSVPSVSPLLAVQLSFSILARRVAAGQAVLGGEPGRLGPAADAELSIDVRQVVLDRLLAEPELAGDLLVRAAGGDLFENLALSRSQAKLVGGNLRGAGRGTG